jgi:hypothetical protein
MASDPWVMAVWPKVVHSLTPLPSDTWPRFQHQSTRVVQDGDTRSGDTFWVAQINGQDVGLAWHWLELFPGVVVHADPNGVYTNLRLVGADGKTVVDELQSIVAINTLIHQLPWQAAVMRHMPRRARSMFTQAVVDERLLLQAA